MPTLVLDPQPRELRELLKHRKRSGLHRLDEVWEGVLHVVSAPSGPHAYIAQQLAMLLGTPARAAGLVPVLGAFNLGGSEADFRVPDGGLHRAVPRATWYPTAALVIEIVSPGDESWQKLPFYAAHHVDEVLIVDPAEHAEHAVHWLALTDSDYRDVQRSTLIDLGPAELAARIDWP